MAPNARPQPSHSNGKTTGPPSTKEKEKEKEYIFRISISEYPAKSEKLQGYPGKIENHRIADILRDATPLRYPARFAEPPDILAKLAATPTATRAAHPP